MRRKCFVISPIGQEPSAIREHADDVYDYIIKPAMDELGIDAYRADHLKTPGRITKQMFESILAEDLCIAILTNFNPNVFYELAIAQCGEKPVIILLEKGQVLPFDVKDLRCVYYDLKPRNLYEKTYVREIVAHVRAIEGAQWKAPLPDELHSATLLSHSAFTHISDLSAAIHHLLSRCGPLVSIDILAHSTEAFLQHFRLKLQGVERVRILFRNPESARFADHVANPEIREGERNQIRTAIRYWSEDTTTAGVKSVTLAQYDFEPSFFLCIVNGAYALLGLFTPSQAQWGYEVRDAMVLSRDEACGANFISSLQAWFDAVLSHKALPAGASGAK